LLKDVVLRRREQHPIPVMDGPLTPNDGLERCVEVGPSLESPDDIAVFERNAGGLAFHPDGRLLVCVSGMGLAAIDATGRRTWLEHAEGVPLLCPTAVTAAPDGMIYLTDGSTGNPPEKWCHDLMEGNARGRLVCCEPDLGGARTLLSGLQYPHGVALGHDGLQLWFTESWAHAVSRYALRDGSSDRVVRNLPGYPARLSAAAAEGTFWLSLFAVRTHLVELVLRGKKYRSEMMRAIHPDFWIAPALAATDSYLEPLQGGAIKKLGMVKPWAPPRSYGLVARINSEGETLESLHSRVGGRRHGVTSAREAHGTLFIACKGHHCLLMQVRESAA
jgi:hypothetical protein